MTEVAIKQADDAYTRQISAQVARITGELNRLEQLLSAGMVDRRVVAEFRDAVNKVRQTSWQVQCWMDGDLKTLSSMLIEQRIRAASQLANHLTADFQAKGQSFAGIGHLRDSMRKLEQVMQEDAVVAR
jgi:phage-related protein